MYQCTKLTDPHRTVQEPLWDYSLCLWSSGPQLSQISLSLLWCSIHTSAKEQVCALYFSLTKMSDNTGGPYLFLERGICHNEGPRLCPRCSSRAVYSAGQKPGANTASLSWPNGSKHPSPLGWQAYWLKRSAGGAQRGGGGRRRKWCTRE